MRCWLIALFAGVAVQADSPAPILATPTANGTLVADALAWAPASGPWWSLDAGAMFAVPTGAKKTPVVRRYDINTNAEVAQVGTGQLAGAWQTGPDRKSVV